MIKIRYVEILVSCKLQEEVFSKLQKLLWMEVFILSQSSLTAIELNGKKWLVFDTSIV